MAAWQIIITALGLVLVFEGLIYFALPDVSRKIILKLLEHGLVRRIGLISIVLGIILIFIASSL